jgi:hypothetical protein
MRTQEHREEHFIRHDGTCVRVQVCVSDLEGALIEPQYKLQDDIMLRNTVGSRGRVEMTIDAPIVDWIDVRHDRVAFRQQHTVLAAAEMATAASPSR